MPTCLIVDDSDVIRRVVKHMLDALGHVSAEASNANEALAECDRQMPDIILLDWHMPAFNVIDFLTQLRLRPKGQRVKVIYSTSENDPVDIARAMTAGANEYIVKPFDRAALAQKLALSA